jgi:hypothetical protein
MMKFLFGISAELVEALGSLIRFKALLFHWEQKRQLSPQLPVRGAGRMYYVVVAGIGALTDMSAAEATGGTTSPEIAQARRKIRGDSKGWTLGLGS